MDWLINIWVNKIHPRDKKDELYITPGIVDLNNALKVKESKNINQIHLSISHEKNYAVASVILEK